MWTTSPHRASNRIVSPDTLALAIAASRVESLPIAPVTAPPSRSNRA